MSSNKSPKRFQALAPDYQVKPNRFFEIQKVGRPRYRFEALYHPFVCQAIKSLNLHGIDGLLPWQGESKTDFDFAATYDPAPAVEAPFPEEVLDFTTEGSTPYSQYNWELFFHAPFLVAVRLCRNQRFLEAQRWFHTIFDPTDTGPGGPERYWKLPPFRDATLGGQSVKTLAELLQSGAAVADQIDRWMASPFQPHVIARLRIVAYQKAVVMKYLDNLIAWGDQLFRQDTIESINEATQLYVLASTILGARPETIAPPARAGGAPTYHTLVQQAQDRAADIEALIPHGASPSPTVDLGTAVFRALLTERLSFCIPANDKLLSYWDAVADRLFKIRSCRNIEGVVRQLPLFEPPIDPALLVRAAAAGVDLASAVADARAAVPHYRFATMLGKAIELCNEVKSLGVALLSAIEKRDAEALAALRAGHELDMLAAVRDVKRAQIEEATRAKEGLEAARRGAALRQTYYANLIKNGRSEKEKHQLQKSQQSLQITEAQLGLQLTAAVLELIPSLKIGSPATIGATFGGGNLGGSIQSFAGALGLGASIAGSEGSMSGIEAGFERRAEEWDQQKKLADEEVKQLDKQILAAEVRLAVATKELDNHDRQAEHAREAADFLRDKFTSEELFDWMVGQTSALYFQSYQMAYELAKRAQQAYRFELADEAASFVQFGHWDSLRRGLLAGERLHFDLRRMEVAYLDNNKRELEIVKHVSLAEHFAGALLQLRETGRCAVRLGQGLFDADFPGHYRRRLKSASLTIPCVTGPHDGVSATLTLGARTRIQRTPGAALVDADPVMLAPQSIVTSSGQADTGLFEANLRDERYLPFEGRGAVESEWTIELPKETNRFERDTLTDVILHLRYTALPAPAAPSALAPANPANARLFSAAHDFAASWYAFLHPTSAAETPRLALPLRPAHFPVPPEGGRVRIESVLILARLAAGVAPESADGLTARLFRGAVAVDQPFAANDLYDGARTAVLTSAGGLDEAWTVELSTLPAELAAADDPRKLDPEKVTDLALLIAYSFGGPTS